MKNWFAQDIRRTFFVLGLWALLGVAAIAAEETVNQGTPGTRGAWPVTVTGAGGGSVSVLPAQCTTTASKSTVVGVAAVSTPAAQLALRKYITICNSLQNTGTPLVKCRVDGTPVMAVTNPGEVLGIGDCFTYPVAPGVIPSCISDTASTNVLSWECT